MSHWAEITGPALGKRIQSQCFTYQSPGGVSYVYVDEKGKRAPEFEASYIRVRVYFLRMNPDLLDELALKVQELPGCTELVIIPNHRTYRPHVLATFDRKAAQS